MDLTPREKLVLSAALGYAMENVDDLNECFAKDGDDGYVPDDYDISVGDVTGSQIAATEYCDLIAKLLHDDSPRRQP